jgi:ABC-2 type transport system ATP-binding protein
MPESECLIPGLSGVEYVALAGILSGLANREAWRHAHRVLDLLGLEEARYRRLEEYSTGMKQRLKLAQALVHRPRLLLLDEPTAGLDPPGRDALLDLLVSLSQELGVSVILSTHHLADVERVCEYVVVLHQGQVRAQGRLEQLRQPTPQQYWLQVFGPLEPLLGALRSHHAMILEVDGQPGTEKTVGLSAAASASTPAEALRDGPAQHAQPQPAKHTLLVRVPNDWPMRRFFELAQAHQCVVQQLVPDTTTPWSEWFGPR